MKSRSRFLSTHELVSRGRVLEPASLRSSFHALNGQMSGT
jgi:hypothetical protein